MPKINMKAGSSSNEMNLIAPAQGEIVDFNKTIEKLEKSSTIKLENGTYLINQTIKLNKSIRLVGEGTGNTIIAGKDLNCLLNSKGNHHIELEGISFISLNEESTTLLQAEDITLIIKECAFTGAALDPDGKSGIGVFIRGKANVEILSCQFIENQNSGVWLENNTTATIIENEFIHNETGFACLGKTSINAVRNNFTGNHVCLALDISSQAKIEGNKFSENRGGIFVQGHANATVLNNNFFKVYGPIGLFENCVAHIEGNEIKDCEMSLLIRNGANATITNNIIDNSDQGIYCKEESNVTITKNSITHQDKFGILVQDSAKTLITDNIIKDNTAGAKFQDQSNFTVLKNQITGHMYGILATGNSRGVIHKNIIKDNNKDPMGWNVNVRENAQVDFDDYKKPCSVVKPVQYSRIENQWVVSTMSADENLSFQELLDKAKPDDEIVLEAGIYNLADPLHIDKPISLIAKSPGEVKLIGKELSHLLSYTSQGRLLLRGIKFILDGVGQTNVVIGYSGKLEMIHCQVEGAKDHVINKRNFGAGLLILGETNALVSESVFKNNVLGISVQENASIKITSNQFIENIYGIVFRDQSKGDSRENEYFSNSNYGLMAYETSKLEIFKDSCHNNKAGFGFMDSVKANIEDAESYENVYHGFFIDNDASCVIKNSLSHTNEISGIAIYGSNKSKLDENEIYQNDNAGVEIGDSAQVEILRNKIIENELGIYLGDNTYAKIIKNQIYQNINGILIQDNASAEITTNQIYQNSEGGIINNSDNDLNISANEITDNGESTDHQEDRDMDANEEVNIGDFFAQLLGSENLSDDPNFAAIPISDEKHELQGIEEEQQSTHTGSHEYQIIYFLDGELSAQIYKLEVGPDTTPEWISEEEKRLTEEFSKENPDAEIIT